MECASLRIKLFHLYSKCIYTHRRLIETCRNPINDCYRSLQSDDELTKSLIDISISNGSSKKQSKLNSCAYSDRKSVSNAEFIEYNTKDLWLDYESFKKNPRYQDLTHEEYTQISELRERQRYNEFKRQHNIKNLATNPIYQGKLLLREIKKSRNGTDLCVNEENQDDCFNQKNSDKTMLYEIVSRIRAKVRAEKLTNSKIAKATIPSVDGNKCLI